MHRTAVRAASRALKPSLLALAAALALAACGGKDKPASQTLAIVDGVEITTSQLNEELALANVPAAQQQAASKRLLDSLVERQLLLAAAEKDKVDRDPKVLQQIARAKAQIIAQAYVQKRVGGPARPTRAEVNTYFQEHPEYFSQRKQFKLRQLVLASADISDELRKLIDSAKSLDEVAAWLKEHNVRYANNQSAPTATDLPAELGKRLLAMKPGQLFIVREGERSVLATIEEVKDVPLTLEQATPQIEQFLVAQRNKETVTAEIARLRGAAKIEFPNKDYAAPAAPAAAKPADDASKATERGVAGLK